MEYKNNEHFSHGFAYDKKKNEWRFHGYICKNCGHVIKSEKVIENHPKICRGKPVRIYGIEPTPENVLDVDGKKWTPIDINQKFSVAKQAFNKKAK